MKFSITDNYLKYLHTDICIISGIFKNKSLLPFTIKINEISQGFIDTLLQRKIFNDEIIGNSFLLYNVPNIPNKLILLIACGEETDLNVHQYRKIIYKTINKCKKLPITKILLCINELNIAQYSDYWKIRHTIEIINDNLYSFNMFKKNIITPHISLNEIILYTPNANNTPQHHKQAIIDGLSISNGIKIAKDLGNMPPNFCTPNYLVNQVSHSFKNCKNIQIEIINSSIMQKLGMNAYLAVGQGSSFNPIMPIIHYQGNRNNPNTPPIILIGKGLTFDSGGISIKTANKMHEMKYDMCGAAAVYAVMKIVVELNLPLNIIGILAICENMISDSSMRPGDILTTLSGQTVEVLNTDAEGRLILCDVLTYVERYHPSIVIDIATLTGACVIALGHHFSGLMSNNDNLANDLIQAANQSKDYVWKLPLDEVFHSQLTSKCADMTNVGNNSGSVITAACFLQKFAHKYHWAHLDIAGTAWISDNPNKSATGRPVALLSQFLINKSFIKNNKS